ncbi:ABC transporter substrate-binding protein [Phaeacidiphilus oryzae]|uniref:ABC transporter substrate-binding protein n=1 Tax=Phaeacidiphilus oryzae TaxID=348818 RepID=UPI00055EB6C5|nr:sugar ABC transporter substrate-binding protein [Phaeacidiphilus oryzae]
MRISRVSAIVAAAALIAVVTGCAGGSGSSGSKTVNWWTWDDKQAAAYKTCATAFEKANPGVTVDISQYNVDDYFTKLTAGFVAGDAPDAFQNSAQFFQSYASLHQLQPLDDYIKADKFDLSRFSVGVNQWKYSDGQQYGLPLDWSAAGTYFNQTALTKAGYSAADVSKLNWNPDNGGTLGKMIAHLTIDDKGRRGDQPGFDKNHVKTYGFGEMAAKDFTGQTTWSPLLSSTGWRQGNTTMWPTRFNYDDPRFVKTMDWIRSLEDKGYIPKIGAFSDSVSDVELLSSGKVAMEIGGSWEATTFAKIPNLKVGIAATPYGPDGKTRSVASGSNGNNIWAGSKNKDLAWKWISYMGSEKCQTMASASGSFFPSISASMTAETNTFAKQGIDLSVFNDMLKDKTLYQGPVYANGQAVQSATEPLFEAYFAHQKNDDVFASMAEQTKSLLAAKNQ